MARPLQPQFKGDFPVRAGIADHFPQIGEEAQHLRTAVPEGVKQPSGVVEVPPDVDAAFGQPLQPLLAGQGQEVSHGIVIPGKFLKPGMRARLLHDSVPAVVPVLPAEFLHQGRTVQRMVDRLPVHVQFFGDLLRFDPVVPADQCADFAVGLLHAVHLLSVIRHSFSAVFQFIMIPVFWQGRRLITFRHRSFPPVSPLTQF